MDTDKNLLFGVLALQVDLINANQFAQACTHWTVRKDVPLADILIELGWMSHIDKADIDRFVDRRLRKYNGDVQASLAASADDSVHQALSQIEDKEIANSLLDVSEQPLTSFAATIDLATTNRERYELINLHAGGGLGRVWLARDHQIGRNVALKDIRPEKSTDTNVQSRFLKEAQITGQLEHPGVVPVYELAQRTGDQQFFYTMRFVKGRTLREAVREHHNAECDEQERAFRLVNLLNGFVAVCNTIAYAHSRGVIHRDLKGHNIILGDYGEVLVLDWGLAKLVGQPDEVPDEKPIHFDVNPQLTLHGQALGTPAYMAPEQAEGKIDLIDHRTDIYGLGAILYEILTGQPPFTGSDVAEVLRKILTEEAIRPTQLSRDAPKNLETVCLRAIAKKASDRYQTASELADAVQQWQEVQRQQAVQALRDSEALYHSLVESLPTCVFRKDLEGRFTFGNKHLADFMARPLDEILGKTDFDLLPRELAENYRRDDGQVLKTGEALERVEEAVNLGSGEKRYLHTLKTAVRDAEGRVVAVQGVFWDITDRKQVEEALARERYLLHALMDNTPDLIYFKDASSRCLRINTALAARYGIANPEQAVGKTDYDFLSQDDAKQSFEDEQKVIRTGEPMIGKEEKETWPDGRVTWASTTRLPFRNMEGEIVGMFGISRDITEFKRAKEELAAERNMLRILIDNLPYYIYVKDTRSRFLINNIAHVRLLGCSTQAEVLGKTDFDFFPQELAARYYADEQTLIESSEPLMNRKELVVDESGEQKWVSSSKLPLRNSSGSIVGILGITRDVIEE